MTSSPSVNLPPRVLVTNIREADRHFYDSVINHSVFTITVLVLCYRSFAPIRHPHEYEPSLLIVLAVTPIDRLHNRDGPNGVKGAAE